MVPLGFLCILLMAGSITATAVPKPDYSQVIAQAACSGVIGAESAYIWAVPRDCTATGDGMTCNQFQYFLLSISISEYNAFRSVSHLKSQLFNTSTSLSTK
uniref:Secreted protein n=1 Tax=Branchiostoma floridae TaxID=7739 RepID=C3Y500_BRAFL|eukprot:XP_002608523.1 hypothetical protein BRAFLDRAFT_92395 [Branchiostoma floridae]